MNFNQVCEIPVVLKGKPYPRKWETIDKETGEKKEGSVHVIRGTLIPNNPNTDPALLREIEFNINGRKIGDTKKDSMDIMELYLINKEKLDKGEAYAVVKTYMGPRSGKDGIVTFFSPFVNDMKIVTPDEDEKPLIKAALNTKEEVF